MQIGDKKHKAQFIQSLKEETQTNIWKNELHLLRLSDELGVLRKELAELDLVLDEKQKPAANEEKKRKFVIEQNISHKEKEMAAVEGTKAQNEYLLTNLLPRYEQAN